MYTTSATLHTTSAESGWWPQCFVVSSVKMQDFTRYVIVK